jgi:hypothetical protein
LTQINFYTNFGEFYELHEFFEQITVKNGFILRGPFFRDF